MPRHDEWELQITRRDGRPIQQSESQSIRKAVIEGYGIIWDSTLENGTYFFSLTFCDPYINSSTERALGEDYELGFVRQKAKPLV